MKERASVGIRKEIIRSILEGTCRIHESLLPERELATRFDVGRPTVREALQRLERDGWITIRKGQPAIVNDYWKQGNLMTIANILEQHEDIPDDFISHMLELRISLTPAYTKDAINHHRLRVISLFVDVEELKDDAESYADFDWHLQLGTAELCSNPIYLLILNSFKNIYSKMAVKYFSDPEHRQASRSYYDELLKAVLKGDPEEAENAAKAMMKKSLSLWKRNMNGEDEYEN
jgi:GntR family transcriptional regulator, negative regulator for fad regulon and positive regulator of fabA